MAKKPLYIQLEPGAYPKDVEWQGMSGEERGCYHSLNVYLACNNGSLLLRQDVLASLCNVSVKVFESFWIKYKHKYIAKNGLIEHKRINKELKRARKMIRQKSLAGKASADKRATVKQQPLNGSATKVSKAKVSKEKLLELNKQGLIFDDKLVRMFGDLTSIERVTFRKIRLFLISLRDLEKMKLATTWITEVKQWGDDHDKNNVEVKKCFVSKIKKMGWKP